MLKYLFKNILVKLSICILLIFNISCNNSNPKTTKIISKDGMVFINGGKFEMGGDNDEARQDEYPKHVVTISSFWMDESEVTNAEFKNFVDETGYITTAERKIDWEEINRLC